MLICKQDITVETRVRNTPNLYYYLYRLTFKYMHWLSNISKSNKLNILNYRHKLASAHNCIKILIFNGWKQFKQFSIYTLPNSVIKTYLNAPSCLLLLSILLLNCSCLSSSSLEATKTPPVCLFSPTCTLLYHCPLYPLLSPFCLPLLPHFFFILSSVHHLYLLLFFHLYQLLAYCKPENGGPGKLNLFLPERN